MKSLRVWISSLGFSIIVVPYKPLIRSQSWTCWWTSWEKHYKSNLQFFKKPLLHWFEKTCERSKYLQIHFNFLKIKDWMSEIWKHGLVHQFFPLLTFSFPLVKMMVRTIPITTTENKTEAAIIFNLLLMIQCFRFSLFVVLAKILPYKKRHKNYKHLPMRHFYS